MANFSELLRIKIQSKHVDEIEKKQFKLMEVFFLKWYTGIKKIAINFLFIPVSNGLAIQIV